MHELALSRPRYGYRRLHVLLEREGWRVNHKRLFHLYREEGLSVWIRRRKKRASHLRTVAPAPLGRNERWAMDFVADALTSGEKVRALTVIDIFSRECLAIEVATSLPSKIVTAVLERVIAKRGKPRTITLDNGTEFTSNHFDAWAYKAGVALDFIRPGRPVENGHIESFNGKLRDECLSTQWFTNLEEARRRIEEWRVDYNERRPHSSLNDLPPSLFVDGRSWVTAG